ncbi:PREDICTED: aromatic-L-amino-acid decarboxylase isoform X1 [Papilio polytes]|nr:PREDICTED: aromatic-L-amino-acid decarboxylase isoform X1 [Papilio polytes]
MTEMDLKLKFETMEAGDFKDFAKAMTDYIAEYLENIRDRPVVPSVKPGYLRPLVPEQAPEQAEPWTAVMADIERVVMSGVTHWHSPRFHAYFPTANSYPAIVADMLSGAIACIGFTWIASPACTELEVVMLDWLGQMLGLPECFLARSGGEAGGVIQGTASEATLVALLGAKSRTMQRVKEQHPEWTDTEILSKLVAYCNKQAHSSVERAGLLGGVKMRSLKPDNKHRLRGDILNEAIDEDIKKGLIPFYVVATLGTTSSCTFDALDEIGDVCAARDVWLHVDAAYAGSAFICPEYRYLMKGVEKADSFNFNPHKWMLVNFDCSAMWLKQPRWIVDAFNVDPLYLKHDQQGSAPDYRHWQIPLGRRFRALKLWFVLRLYGVENLQKHIRKHIALAHLFERLCTSDERFEIVEEVTMGLVCFRLKGSNDTNEELLRRINGRGKIHLVPSKIDDVYFLRLAICSRFSEDSDIHISWEEIKHSADEVLAQK